MRLGIYGGSFDPIHHGHRILAAEGLFQLGLNEVLWVLTPDNPLKEGQSVAPLHDRIAMLQAAIAGQPGFSFSRVDLDRDPPHYAADTVRLLGAAYPGAELVYLMGGDSLRDLPRWHRPLELLAACQALAVMRRPGDALDLDTLEAHLPGIGEKLTFIEAPLLEISASEIRRRAASGAPIRYYLPEPVYEMIQERGLYGLKVEG
jgi:nicotinate-nucleotide adenylyltransferase